MFVVDDLFSPPIQELVLLTSMPFAPSAFRKVCEEFSVFDEQLSDDNYWKFNVKDDIALLVGVGEDNGGLPKVTCAVLPFIWWDTYSRSQHQSEESYLEERAKYDELYNEALAKAVEVIGQPFMSGEDNDEQAHKWSIWRGKTGILILQQSAYDPQFGFDINFWIQPWGDCDLRPGSPIIDWLFSLSGKSKGKEVT